VAIARNDPAYVPAVVANTILGGGFTSQLIEELRIKRSLTYSAWSMFAARLAGGDFRLGTFTKTPTTTETLALALSVEGEFRSHFEPISPQRAATPCGSDEVRARRCAAALGLTAGGRAYSALPTAVGSCSPATRTTAKKRGT